MKQLNWKLFPLLVLVFLAFTACEEKSKFEKAADKIENTTEEIGDVFRTEQEELQHDMKETRENIEERIIDLRADLANAGSGAKATIIQQIQKLETQSKKLGDKMEQMGDEVVNNWKEFKVDVKKQLDEIDKDIERNL